MVNQSFPFGSSGVLTLVAYFELCSGFCLRPSAWAMAPWGPAWGCGPGEASHQAGVGHNVFSCFRLWAFGRILRFMLEFRFKIRLFLRLPIRLPIELDKFAHSIIRFSKTDISRLGVDPIQLFFFFFSYHFAQGCGRNGTYCSHLLKTDATRAKVFTI